MAGTGGTPRGFALARLNSNGSPDSKFGAAGTVLTELPGRAYAVTCAIT